jgi:uncharacterized protein
MNRIIFFLTITTIMLLIDAYFWQAFRINIDNRGKNYYLIPSIYWTFSVITIVATFYGFNNFQQPTMSVFLTSLRGLVFALFICKFLGILPLLIDDIIRIFKLIYQTITGLFSDPIEFKGSPISRIEFLKRAAIVLAGLMFSTLSYGVLFGRYNFKKHKLKVRLNKWSKSITAFKIVQISDLHLGGFGSVKKLEEAVKLINEENADLILFTGDLVNNFYWEADPYVETLKKIKSKNGIYSVLGNHDYSDYTGINKKSPEGKKQWNDHLNNMIEMHKTIGFNLLLNQHETISINNQKINIVGVENWGNGNFSKYGDLDLAMQNVDDKYPTILLSHDPSHWEEKVQKHPKKIDIQFAGHTHGMQFGIEIGKFKWSPAKWKYKQWAGLYNKGNHQIYVNRGIGHLGYPGRVGIMPEITVIEISA